MRKVKDVIYISQSLYFLSPVPERSNANGISEFYIRKRKKWVYFAKCISTTNFLCCCLWHLGGEGGRALVSTGFANHQGLGRVSETVHKYRMQKFLLIIDLYQTEPLGM